MHALTDSEFQSQAEPILKKVFLEGGWAPNDGFGELFTSNITSRIILYPQYHGIPDCLSTQVLVDAALKIGDIGCYLFPWWNGPSNYCYIPLSEFVEGYHGEPGSSTTISRRIGVDPYSSVTTIVSSEGNWGLFTSSEHHVLLGGSPEFMEEIRRGTPNIDDQLYEFFDFWQNHWHTYLLEGFDYGPYQWLPILLNHIYGEEKGAQLLQESGLPWKD